jgi:hypothetical protein
VFCIPVQNSRPYFHLLFKNSGLRYITEAPVSLFLINTAFQHFLTIYLIYYVLPVQV